MSTRLPRQEGMVISMKSSLIVLENLTQANKAKSHLAGLKIEASVEKITENKGGCGYGIRVYGDSDRICRLLSVVNINCKAIKR